MRLMGLEALYPKKRTSKPNAAHRRFPYLQKGLASTRPNQVWATDVTYVPMAHGFLYLVAVIDLASRVPCFPGSSPIRSMPTSVSRHWKRRYSTLAGRRSSTPTKARSSRVQRFCMFWSATTFVSALDGKGRCRDNVFVERLWRSVKYEEIYLKAYNTVNEAREGLANYFCFYNHERRHQTPRTYPWEPYTRTMAEAA